MNRPKRFVPLPEPVAKMSAAELRVYLAGCPRQVVIRSLLLNEHQRLQDSGLTPPVRTLRGLWYELVKPVLAKLDMLERVETADAEDRLVGECLAELLRSDEQPTEGEQTPAIGHKSLGVVDGSQRHCPAAPAGVPFVQLAGRRSPEVIIHLQRTSLWPILEDLAGFFGVSAVAGGGLAAFAAVEDLLAEIAGSSARKDPELRLLTITDYDPNGFHVAETIRDQLHALAPHFGLAAVHMTRLGVVPEQVNDLNLATHPLEESLGTVARASRWMSATGGVGGQYLGIELDAVPVRRLRQLYADALCGLVAESDLVADAVRAVAEQVAAEHLQSQVEHLMATAHAAVSTLSAEIEVSPQELVQKERPSLRHEELLGGATRSEIERRVRRALGEL